ncbi:MAG: hypothetical protein R3D85_13965 [Paracoccaceae bacterium]
MKYAIPLIFAAGPALAHPGAHLHPQQAAPWIMVLAFVIVATGAMLAAVRR